MFTKKYFLTLGNRKALQVFVGILLLVLVIMKVVMFIDKGNSEEHLTHIDKLEQDKNRLIELLGKIRAYDSLLEWSSLEHREVVGSYAIDKLWFREQIQNNRNLEKIRDSLNKETAYIDAEIDSVKATFNKISQKYSWDYRDSILMKQEYLYQEIHDEHQARLQNLKMVSIFIVTIKYFLALLFLLLFPIRWWMIFNENRQ